MRAATNRRGAERSLEPQLPESRAVLDVARAQHARAVQREYTLIQNDGTRCGRRKLSRTPQLFWRIAIRRRLQRRDTFRRHVKNALAGRRGGNRRSPVAVFPHDATSLRL